MAKDSHGWAFIGTLPIVGYILVMLSRKKDKYAMFYGKQGLVLGIAFVIGSILMIIPPLGMVWNGVCTVLWVISVVNAFSGKKKATPIVGKYAAKF